MFLKKNKNLKFSKCIWLNLREKRKFVVKDLMQRELLLNMTKKEVIDFLGFEFNDSNSNIWTYFVGKKYYVFFAKRRFLTIFFDKQGLVYKTKYN